jgi:hypothetical protein
LAIPTHCRGFSQFARSDFDRGRQLFKFARQEISLSYELHGQTQ